MLNCCEVKLVNKSKESLTLVEIAETAAVLFSVMTVPSITYAYQP